jgi:hypothetical protein
MNIAKLRENFESNPKYKLNFKVKKYISVIDRIEFIENIKENCVEVSENGMFEVNYILVDMKIHLFLVDYATDVELDNDKIMEEYDFLLESGVMDYIIKNASAMNDNIRFTASQTLSQEISNRNSIEGIIASGIYKLIDKIPNEDKWMEIAGSIKNFDTGKLKMIKDLFNFANDKK